MRVEVRDGMGGCARVGREIVGMGQGGGGEADEGRERMDITIASGRVSEWESGSHFGGAALRPLPSPTGRWGEGSLPALPSPRPAPHLNLKKLGGREPGKLGPVFIQ